MGKLKVEIRVFSLDKIRNKSLCLSFLRFYYQLMAIERSVGFTSASKQADHHIKSSVFVREKGRAHGSVLNIYLRG